MDKQTYRWTLRGMLTVRYSDMSRRVRGKPSGDRKTCPWLGMEVCSVKEFVAAAMADEKLKRLHADWVANDFARRYAPSVHRIDSTRGYTLDNITWVTQHENSLEALAKGQETKRRKKAQNV